MITIDDLKKILQEKDFSKFLADKKWEVEEEKSLLGNKYILKVEHNNKVYESRISETKLKKGLEDIIVKKKLNIGFQKSIFNFFLTIMSSNPFFS